MSLRITLAIALAALSLGACERKPVEEPRPPPAAPLSFVQKTPAAEVSLTIQRRVQLYPGLHLKLYNDGKRELLSFAKQAAEDRADEKPGEPVAPYVRNIRWRVTATNPYVVSLKQDWYDFTGGAHPNQGATALLWDRRREAPILQSTLFRPDADYKALDAVLCEAVRKAKVARLGAEAAGGVPWICPKWSSAEAVFVRSSVAGKFGGLIFLFDPHALGAEFAGSYEITIPQAAFHAALAPTYEPMFDGVPAPRRPPAPATR